MSQQMGGPETLVGRVFGGYRLERIVGDGGTGVVYLGRKVSDTPGQPEQAAVKVLKLFWYTGGQQREELRSRFRHEVETWQRLHHPHILSVISSGEEDSWPYIVLQYADGGTLANRIATSGGHMPFQEVARYLTQLADALDYAHQQGVVHRDVKPSNVLLDRQDNLYLTDFSIAKLLEGTQTTLTGTGLTIGTPAYMAPDQQRGNQISSAADVYSLGVVLYQMVTGQLPFSGTDPIEILHSHRHDAPPPPRRLRPDLPPAAEAAILKALEKRPEDRFRTGGALARAFEAGLQGRYIEGLQQNMAAAAPTVYPPAQQSTVPALPADSMIPARGGGGPPTPVRILLAGMAALLVVSGIAVLLANGHITGSPSVGGKTVLIYPPTATPYPPTSTTRPGYPTPTPYPPTATPNLTPIPATATPMGTQATPTSTSVASPATPTFTPIPPTPTFTPVPPTPTSTPVVLSGNVADQASLSPSGTGAVIDENLSTQWVGGHGPGATITFSWSVPVTIHHIIVWDRPQNSPDNNQINLLGISMSDGAVSHNINMDSGGPRCADITLASNHTVTSVQVYPWDSSGNNGYSEIEIWATTGPQSSGLSCSNSQTM